MLQEQPALRCDAAVAAAVSALPGDHAPIQRIQFIYGSVAPGGRIFLRDEEQPVLGYVVFTYAGGHAEYVDVNLWRGEITTGEPMAYGEE